MEMISSFEIQHIIEEVVIPLGQYSSGLDSNFVDLFLSSVQNRNKMARILYNIFKTFLTFCNGVNSFKIKLFYTVK